MSRSPAPLRRTVRSAAAAAVALAAVGAAAFPAAASTAARHPARTPATAHTRGVLAAGVTTGTEGVELQLTPRNRAGLAQLATATGLSRATRLSRLAPLLAGTGRAGSVAATLRREGLTVTSTSALSVTATGPAATVAALFGTAQSRAAALSQPLPHLPAALSGLVTVVYGGDDTRPAELPLGIAHASGAGGNTDGTLTVAQARSMYGTAPSSASPSSTGPIIATLQFTTAAVVTQGVTNAVTYAQDNDLYADSSYDPSSSITPVDVSESCTEDVDHSDDGDEVGLDQETLLTVAPQLRQRIYYTKNCGDGQDDALGQIVTDVQNGMPIVALSTSWGGCEPQSYGSTTADVDAVDSLLAAGVTMFAATGDSGSFDCVNSEGQPIGADAVDTPAAIPGVVAVGGTEGTDVSALDVWNNGNGAAGGGFSCGHFARPSYQAKVAKAASYPDNGYACPSGKSERMVPDISEDAGDGLDAVVTDSDDRAGSQQTVTAGILGTSFAAPLAAGGFATALFNRGVTTGIGDIHGFLYAGHGIHDVRSGNNGDYRATTGYDVASGLGSPVWSQVIASGSDLTDVSVASTGVVQVRSAYAGDSYEAASGLLSSGLTVTDPANWRFVVAPYRGDGAADLWAVHLAGAAGTQLEVFSQASGYRSALLGTSLPTAGYPAADVQIRVAPYASDGASDLYVIQTKATPSRRIEVNMLSAASGYRTWTLHHRTTAIAVGNNAWTFLVGDRAGSGNLVGVLDGGTTSGHTEVHILSRTSGYQTFTLHAKTPLAEFDGSGRAQFSLRDLTGDGVPDVVLALLDGTTSGDLELHVLTAPTFGTFFLHRATGLAPAPSTDTVALAE